MNEKKIMSLGVRASNEIVKNMGSSVSVYEELAVHENKVVMDIKDMKEMKSMENMKRSASRHLSVPGRESREEFTGVDEQRVPLRWNEG